MQPKLSLLNDELISRIIAEAYQLLIKPGIKVQNAEARQLLAEAGAHVDEETMVVRIPEQIVTKHWKLSRAISILFDYDGNPRVQYGGDAVQFDPGSSGDHRSRPDTLEHKTAETADLIRIIKVAEKSRNTTRNPQPSFAMMCQRICTTCIVCIWSCSFKETDRHRCVQNKTVQYMIDMLAILRAARDKLRESRARSLMSALASADLVKFRCGQLDGIGTRRRTRRDRIHAACGRGGSCHIARLGHTTCRGMSIGHHHPSTRSRGFAHRLGRRACHLRHAQRRHTFRRSGNCNDRFILRAGRQIAWPAHTRIHGRNRIETCWTCRQARKRRQRHDRRVERHQHDLRFRHVGFSSLPQPGKIGH